MDKTVTVPAGSFSHCLEVTNRRKGGKATVVTLYAPGVGVVQREETSPLIAESGAFHSQRRDKAVMRLRERWLSATAAMCLLSLDGADDQETPTPPTAAATVAEGSADCRPQ